MARRKRTDFENTKRRQEYRMAKTLDDAREFEDFKDDILPKIRQMLKAGKSAEEIYTFAQSYAAARTVTIALTEVDSAKALAASKDVLDRTQGKPKERKEVEHTFSKLKDDELDSLILSQFKDLDDEDSETIQ